MKSIILIGALALNLGPMGTMAQAQASPEKKESGIQQRLDFLKSLDGNYLEESEKILNEAAQSINKPSYGAGAQELRAWHDDGVIPLTSKGVLIVMWFDAIKEKKEAIQKQMQAWGNYKRLQELASFLPDTEKPSEFKNKLQGAKKDHNEAIHQVKLVRREIAALEIMLFEFSEVPEEGVDYISIDRSDVETCGTHL